MLRPSPEELLKLAQAGDRSAFGELLEQFRNQLRGKAEQELSSRLKVRVDASDIVQATFLDAHRDLEDFQGEEIGQFIAWLNQILKHNVLQSVEMHKLAQKRSINQETPLEDSAGEGTPKRNQLAADQSTPSGRVQRSELAEQLLAAMESLPEDQQTAVRLRFLQGMSLEQIAESMGKTKTAVAGLLKRGMQVLRRKFPEDPS